MGYDIVIVQLETAERQMSSGGTNPPGRKERISPTNVVRNPKRRVEPETNSCTKNKKTKNTNQQVIRSNRKISNLRFLNSGISKFHNWNELLGVSFFW